MLLIWIRVIWIAAVLINLSGVIWFILGSTANFQRGIDLITTVVMMYFGAPSIVLIVVSMVLLLKRWSPLKWGKIGVIGIIICMLWLTPPLYESVNTSGWLIENVQTDTLQKTADGRYEYNIELVNLFQRNSYARLYLKSVSMSAISRIRVDIPLNEIDGLSIGEVNHWIKLEPYLEEGKYLLYTTEDFPLPGERFEIDVKKGKAVRLKQAAGQIQKVELKRISYKKAHMNIQYPSIVGLNDPYMEKKVNQRLKSDALEITKLYQEDDKTSLDIMFIPTWIGKSLLSIQYIGTEYTSGAAHPINIMYTSNVNLLNAKKITLQDAVKVTDDFIELYKLGNYIKFNPNLDVGTDAMKELANFSNPELIRYFTHADEASENNALQVFTYFTKDALGISAGTAHALGDHFEIEVQYKDLIHNRLLNANFDTK
ncbi:DUF4163 domain-containing protein [Paenibacillus sp. R14(2021)]|uniref:DUF4163 domain-containing protein n=1 Tax=Paenibacillus sp. R14(2021) TaxID=2859228 RepID=UPI001C612A5D|nr:DUF4163 domain-containing protein [Paenibacillus sp. R14(2021)]